MAKKPCLLCWIIAIGLIAGAIALVKSAINKIRVQQPSIKITSFADPITFTLSVIITNDNNFQVNANLYSGTIYYNNNLLAIFSAKNIVIPAFSSTQLDINGSTGYQNLAADILSLIKSKTFDTTMHVDSHLFYENVSIPLSFDVPII